MTTMTTDDDLAIPSFLKTSGPVKKFRAPRWKKMPTVEKPTGERYEDAERWDVFVENTETFLKKLGSGQRKLWVAEAEDGSKWVWLHDGENEAKLAFDEWGRMSAKGRRIA